MISEFKKNTKIRLADIKQTSASLLSNIIGICSIQYPTQRKNALLVCDSKYHMLHQNHLSFYNRTRSYGETTALYRYRAGDFDWYLCNTNFKGIISADRSRADTLEFYWQVFFRNGISNVPLSSKTGEAFGFVILSTCKYTTQGIYRVICSQVSKGL